MSQLSISTTSNNNNAAYVDEQVIVYSDLSMNPSQVDQAINAEAVMNSVINIITTKKGERLNRPEFGCNIEEYLFDILDVVSANALFSTIVSAIRRWDNRVNLDMRRSKCTPLYDDHVFELDLYFTIEGLDDVEFNVRRFYAQRKQ